MSDVSLDAALSGATETETETQEVVEKTETTETETEVTAEKPEGETTETEESKPDSAAQETEDKGQQDDMVPLAGLKDERRKRQEAESREQGLLGRITQLEGKPEAKKPAPLPDPIDDPQGFAKRITTDIRAENQAENLKTRLAVSQNAMRRHAEDFDEVIGVFTDLARTDRNLAVKMLQSEDPYFFAYEHAKKHQEFKDVSNVDEWKDKTRAELRTEIEAEIRKELGQEAETEEKNEVATEMPSLAGKTSVEAGVTSAAIDKALEDILPSY
jgi:hypothetical protein